MKFTVKRTLPLLGLLALSLRAQPAVQVIASGLDNPRGLAFGPKAPCMSPKPAGAVRDRASPVPRARFAMARPVR